MFRQLFIYFCTTTVKAKKSRISAYLIYDGRELMSGPTTLQTQNTVGLFCTVIVSLFCLENSDVIE